MTSLLTPATLVLASALLAGWLLPGAAHVLRRRVLLLGMLTLAVLPVARWVGDVSGVSFAVDAGLSTEPGAVLSSSRRADRAHGMLGHGKHHAPGPTGTALAGHV
jgi:hypothetical protein